MVDTNQGTMNSVPSAPEFSQRRGSFYTASGKRLFDIVLATALIPLCIIPILLIGLLVKLDGGPVFFGHKRVGIGGREFRCFKLRTMLPDAEAVLQDYLDENESARIEWQKNFKLKNDPRITSLGKFLRKTSLDELPQIFNVLIGDMSFVGPRPVPKKELKEYASARHAYLLGRPGITGLWQVSGRNSLDYRERVVLDIQYRRSETFMTDLKILLKTPIALLRPNGI